jgi:hypothetical protein
METSAYRSVSKAGIERLELDLAIRTTNLGNPRIERGTNKERF